MSDLVDAVSLPDAIAGLRRQIKAAADQAKGLAAGDTKFRITNVELELNVVAEDTTDIGGEIGWWIFKAKASAATKDVITHKVTLTLDVGDIEVRGEITG